MADRVSNILPTIPIGLRVHAETIREEPSHSETVSLPGEAESIIAKQQRRTRAKVAPRPDRLAVLDTETATVETVSSPLTMKGFAGDSQAPNGESGRLTVFRWDPAAQALLFGRLHLYERQWDDWRKTAEYLFYPDDLPASALARLERRFRFLTYRMGDWREPKDAPGVRAYLLPLSEFLNCFYWECVVHPTLIAGFNLGFDLTRLASKVGRALKNFYRGGFSVELWPSPVGKIENKSRPRVWIKNLDGRVALAFGPSVYWDKAGSRQTWMSQSRFLELKRLAEALTGELGLSLEKAAGAFGLAASKQAIHCHGLLTLKYLVYNRQDVELTTSLAFACLNEFDKHPFSRGYVGDERSPAGTASEDSIFSSASIAKNYLRVMNVHPRLMVQPDFPREILGAGMEAFYGGRSEVKVRDVAVPVVYTDVTSMYPTVAVLLGIWRLMTAERLDVVDATDEVRRFLDTISVADVLRRENWQDFAGLALAEADGDVLPVRGQYGDAGSWTIGINYYTSARAQWFAIPDLIASKIVTGRAPRILRAVRFQVIGLQELRPTKLRGMVNVDPTDDFFKVLVEERARVKKKIAPYEQLSATESAGLAQALKLTVNSASFGISAELNRQNPSGDKKSKVRAWSGAAGDPWPPTFDAKVWHPEEPGAFYFPPIAALVTAGARLVLMLVECLLREKGGIYVFMDTDSAAIVASANPARTVQRIDARGSDSKQRKQTIKVLGWSDVEDIARGLNGLNPYDQTVIPSLLKIENENFDGERGSTGCSNRRDLQAFAVSPKRYCFFEQRGEQLTIVDRSESALGAYMQPGANWQSDWWHSIVKNKGCPNGDLPAVRRYQVASWDVYSRFARFNRGKPYQAQMKPFNFCLTVEASLVGQASRTLIAVYETKPDRWLTQEWIDYASGERVDAAVTVDWGRPASELVGDHGWSLVPVKTFADVYSSYQRHPINECLGPDGTICGENTRGILARRAVQAGDVHYLGKESNEIERLEVGVVSPDEKLLIRYGGSTRHWVEDLIPILRDAGPSIIASDRVLRPRAERTWRAWITEKQRPAESLRTYLSIECSAFARGILQRVRVQTPKQRTELLRIYSQERGRIVRETAAMLAAFARKNGVHQTSARLGVSYAYLRKRLSEGLASEPITEVIALGEKLQ